MNEHTEADIYGHGANDWPEVTHQNIATYHIEITGKTNEPYGPAIIEALLLEWTRIIQKQNPGINITISKDKES